MSGARIIPVGGEPPPLNPVRKVAPGEPGKPKAKGKSHGRFAVINTFIDDTMHQVKRAARDVWFILWRDTKPDGLARASQKHIARRAGCNVRTVRRALKTLESAGLLTVSHQGGLNRGMSVYRVHPTPTRTQSPAK